MCTCCLQILGDLLPNMFYSNAVEAEVRVRIKQVRFGVALWQDVFSETSGTKEGFKAHEPNNFGSKNTGVLLLVLYLRPTRCLSTTLS